MADAPTATSQDLALVNAQLAALAHKHVTVSYLLIGVVALVLAVAGVGAWAGLRFADAQLARAEQAEARYDSDHKAFSEALAQNAVQRTQEAAQQQVLVKVVDTRDKTADQTIKTVMAPDTTAQGAALALGSSYSDVPSFGIPTSTPDGLVALTVNQAQLATVSRIDLVRTKSDLADTLNEYGLEQQKSVSLQLDLSSSLQSNKECEVVVQKYKKAAKSSRFRKMLHGAGEAVAIVGAFYLGRKL